MSAGWYACSTCGTALSGSTPTPKASSPEPRRLGFWGTALAVFTGAWLMPMLVSFGIACVVGIGGLLILGSLARQIPPPPRPATRTVSFDTPAPRWTPLQTGAEPTFPVKPAAPPRTFSAATPARLTPSPTLVVHDNARWERQPGGLWRVTRRDGTVEYVTQGPDH